MIRWFFLLDHRSTNKSYSRDNRLMSPDSTHRRARLAPRCRLILSRDCIRTQGCGCSPHKKVRELGLERREPARILSSNGLECSRVYKPRTRGAVLLKPLVQMYASMPRFFEITTESILSWIFTLILSFSTYYL